MKRDLLSSFLESFKISSNKNLINNETQHLIIDVQSSKF